MWYYYGCDFKTEAEMFKRCLIPLLFLAVQLSANIADIPKKVEIEGKFARNKECVRCHLDIYIEFKNSKHRLSNVLNDPIHKAMWDKNPLSKKQKYVCAKCHAPSSEEIKKLMDGTLKPKKSDKSIDDGISCAFCHRIKDIKKHHVEYEYVLLEDKAHYFGNRKVKMKSDFHKIDEGNQKFKNADICLSCHTQHSKNKQLVLRNDNDGKVLGYCVYSKLDNPNADRINNKKENCVTCHMPQVDGSLTDRINTKTHAYHGFAGVSKDLNMLEKYVSIELKRLKKGFAIKITNNAPHDLLLHPLRQLVLKVKIDGDKSKKLKDVIFQKESTNEALEPLSWLKDNIKYKNTIPPKSTKTITYTTEVDEGDMISVTLGYYLIKPEVAKKIGFKDEESLKFREFKKRVFFY